MKNDNLTENEKEKAKENGFILVGKRGSGKTHLLNVIFDKDVRIIEQSQKKILNELTIYFYKLENGKYISLIDTIGFLYEFNKKNNEDIKRIITIITEENIHIKSILFLINFQNERIDLVEKNVLLIYNMFFPSKMFWNNLIVIFTHFYSEIGGKGEREREGKEKIKSRIEESNKELFYQLVKNIKGVSGVINYKDLNILYFNSYWPIKNHQMKLENIRIKKELEYIVNNLIENETLYTQIEIIEIKNYCLNDIKFGKKYLFEMEIIGFFDLQKKLLKEYATIKSNNEISDIKTKLPEFQFKIKVLNATINDDNDNLEFIRSIANENNSHYFKYFYGSNKNKEINLINLVKNVFVESEEQDMNEKIDLFLKNILKEKENIFLNKYNKEEIQIKKLNEKIKELQNILRYKDKQINTLTTKVKELKIKIEKLLNNLKESENSELLQNKKLISLIFMSYDKKIHYSIVCKRTDEFSKIEKKIYNIYPDYEDIENVFLVNDRIINKFNTLEDNQIFNSDIILLLKPIKNTPK